MKHSAKSIWFGAIALLVGLAIGVSATKAMDNNQDHTSPMASMSATDDKACDLRADLVTLGIEHMVYTDQAVDAALDGAPNASQTAAALYKNGTDIGAAVGSFYGKDAEKTFNAVWKLHLDEFVKYAVASSQGDESGKKAALNAIDSQYTKPLAQYLANANPNLPESALKSALSEHVSMTAKMIDYHVNKQYQQEADELALANKHMEGIMTVLANGIVKQFPAKF